ncbi:ABC transporter substrate-binding protein [Rhizobium sp. RCC_161_2]|uniref:ABC transporter substrate-binding protein n=1 Tax=Rhizobium sp. RCC_161_2 TaxID=3239219 RepID=UPI003526538A
MNRASTVRRFTTAVFLFALTGSAALADTTVRVLRAEVPADEKAYYDTIVKEFETTHPGVNVVFEYLANEAYKQKLTTLLQSNQKPDIIFSWAGGVLRDQAAAGVLEDISASFTGNWASSLSPASVQAFTVNGKVYGVPLGASDVVFWTNKELAQKAGINPEALKTWSDFLDAVKKAKAAGVTPIVVGGKDKWPLHFYYGYLMLREAGKAGLAAAIAGKDDGFAAGPFIKAGKDFKQLLALEPFQPGFMDTTYEQATGQFGDGKALFHLMGDWDYGTSKQNSVTGKGVPDDKLTTVRFPAVPGGDGLPSDTFGGITGWSVIKGAPPEAVEFLKSLSSLENQKKGGAAGIFIPVANGAETAITNPFMRKMSEALGASTYHQLFLDQELGADVGATINDVAADLAQGATTPEEAAKTVQDAWSTH